MARHTNPADAWKLGFDSWRMISEAQYVVALRVAGMSGLWRMQPSETTRMVSEKNAAFTQSATKALMAASSGARPTIMEFFNIASGVTSSLKPASKLTMLQ